MTLGMRVFLAIVALIVSGGCEATHAQSDPHLVSEWSFQSPRGWTKAGNQTWRSSTPPQLISLHIMPARRPVDLRIMFDPYGTTSTRLTLCHGLPALFGESRPWFGSVVSDEIATQKSGSIAVASYHYPRFYNPDAGAESSIRSICPRAH